jgi:hypothetical protein
VFFGAYRKPEAVVMPVEQYYELLEMLDDLTIALEVRGRDRADTGERIDLEDFARDQGLELT